MNLSFDLAANDASKPGKLSKTGKFLVGITGGVALGLSVVCISFVSPAFRKYCLPYIPATRQQIENIFRALNGRKGSFVDLGSGDGRIVLEAARQGFVAHGVELNVWLVLYSKLNALRLGASQKAKFQRRNLWEFDLGSYENIVIFGVGQMMGPLEAKFVTECCENSYIVACRFPLPNIKPTKTIGSGIDTVWVYEMGKSRGSKNVISSSI